MSKIKFGNFITYTGKYLSTAMSKAQSGNLVFARIINSPAETDAKAKVTLANVIVDGELKTSYEVNNVGKDGYYIFGGKADGHLVTFNDFKALKAEVAALNTKVGDLSIDKKEYADVPAYVAAYVDNRLKTLEAYKVKDVVVGATSIVGASGIVELGNAAKKNVATAIAKDSTDLATAGQVYDYINAIPEVVVAGSTGIAVAAPVTADGKTTYTVSVDETIATKDYVNTQVSKIDGVMEFKGLYEGEQLPTVTKDSTDYNPGDVIVWNNKEYVLDKSYKWIEIGQVRVDEAVTSAKGSTYVSVAGNGENAEKRGDITISVVTSAIEEGATGLATAADVYAAVKAAKDAATVTGASGYLMVDKDKNVVVDAAQVQLGATSTDAKLATKGYVDDEIAKVGLEAAKHSSVKSASETYIGVTGVTLENGSVEYRVSLDAAALAAENHTIGEIKKELEGGKEEILTEATTVQGALQELFEGQYTASASLDNLNDRLDAHIGSTQAHAAENITYAGASGITTTNVKDALDDLYSKVDNIEVPVTGVEGDAASYSDVATDKAGKVTVKNTLATAVGITGITGATAATATGLVTDAWVKDYITSILAWEILEDQE